MCCGSLLFLMETHRIYQGALFLTSWHNKLPSTLTKHKLRATWCELQLSSLVSAAIRVNHTLTETSLSVFFSKEGYSFFARSLSFTPSFVLLCTHSFSPDLGETSRHWGPRCVNATYPGKLIKNRVCLWKREWVRERKQKEEKKDRSEWEWWRDW